MAICPGDPVIYLGPLIVIHHQCSRSMLMHPDEKQPPPTKHTMCARISYCRSTQECLSLSSYALYAQLCHPRNVLVVAQTPLMRRDACESSKLKTKWQIGFICIRCKYDASARYSVTVFPLSTVCLVCCASLNFKLFLNYSFCNQMYGACAGGAPTTASKSEFSVALFVF